MNKQGVEMIMKRFMQAMVTLLVLVGCIGLASAADKKDEAKALVKKAVAFIKQNGPEKAFAEINNPAGKFVKGELYIFVLDSKATMMAHGANQKLVGKVLLAMKDADGAPFNKNLLDVAKRGGGWSNEYRWTNPVSKKIEPKIAYIEPAGDLVVGCGFYK
jgi:cytochrome c